MTARTPAALVLEDGRTFRGEAYGAVGSVLGEVAFTTAMTGYQETLTDPACHRQIVVQTAPQIGNTGWNDEDSESAKIWAAGHAVREPARVPSNWRSARSLESELRGQGVVGIAGIDTRALTRHLRELGTMRGGVFSGTELGTDQEMVDQVRAAVSDGAVLGDVTTAEPYVVQACGNRTFRVAALDLGIKSRLPQMLAKRGIEVHVLPATSSWDEVRATEADGVVLSSGPGDPATMDHQVDLARRVIGADLPLLGIGLGHQILGRALGLRTYQLTHGHHGANVPVLSTQTGRVAITAHNHAFAVEGQPGAEFDTDLGRAQVSQHCANDGAVEGLRMLNRPAVGVQYNPEAAAGPHDAAALFDEFADVMSEAR